MAKKRKITPLTLLLGITSILVGVLIISFLTEMLAGPVEDFLKKSWGEKNHLFYLGCILASCLIILLLAYLLENGESNEGKTETNASLRDTSLKNLKELYEKRLHDKMVGELNFEIKLNLKYTTQGTSPETIEDFFVINSETEAGDFDRLFEDYVNKLWRLLILGEPGAGKSILLLRFGLGLIGRAEKDPNFPIPILLDLATWKDENQTFEYWLEMNLPYIGGSFAVSKKDAKELVKSQNLLLLLDGFDEISSDYRNSCFNKLLPYLQRMKNGRRETYPEVILCSRILEYEAAEDAPVFASVKIQPLTKEEVETVLKVLGNDRNFPEARRLQAFLQRTPKVYSAISSAFFLHMLLDISQLDRLALQGNSIELLQKEIIEVYTDTEINKIKDYPKEKVKKWLGWLAWNMKHRNGSISIELIDLQPMWTKRKYVYSLVLGSVGGFIFGFTWGLVFGSVEGLVFGLGVGLVGGLVTGLGFGLTKNRIETSEIKKINLKEISRGVFTRFFSIGLIYGLFGGLLGGLAFGLVGGLSGSLVFGLVGGLVDGLPIDASFPKVNNPYKRFFAQFWRDIIQWSCTFSLALGLGTYGAEKPYNGFILGLWVGCLVAIMYSPIFKHTSLRLVLWLEKVIPLRLVTFLDSVSKTGLLIKDGGQWRFRHQLIHDSLTQWFEENHAELLSKEV